MPCEVINGAAAEEMRLDARNLRNLINGEGWTDPLRIHQEPAFVSIRSWFFSGIRRARFTVTGCDEETGEQERGEERLRQAAPGSREQRLNSNTLSGENRGQAALPADGESAMFICC